jgi:hypothetical protein
VSCAAPVPWETLVAYWAGDLAEGDEAALEEHVMGCATCAAESARVAAVTETLRGITPPVVTRATLAKLRARGARIDEHTMAPGEEKTVPMPRGVDFLIHRLGGLDLTGADRVRFMLRVESTGRVLVTIDEAPFDRDEGAVLVACQRHYAALPPDTRAEVTVRDASGAERVTSYLIVHVFEP